VIIAKEDREKAEKILEKIEIKSGKKRQNGSGQRKNSKLHILRQY
jgi:hypothetical protein